MACQACSSFRMEQEGGVKNPKLLFLSAHQRNRRSQRSRYEKLFSTSRGQAAIETPALCKPQSVLNERSVFFGPFIVDGVLTASLNAEWLFKCNLGYSFSGVCE